MYDFDIHKCSAEGNNAAALGRHAALEPVIKSSTLVNRQIGASSDVCGIIFQMNGSLEYDFPCTMGQTMDTNSSLVINVGSFKVDMKVVIGWSCSGDTDILSSSTSRNSTGIPVIHAEGNSLDPIQVTEKMQITALTLDFDCYSSCNCSVHFLYLKF